MPHANCESPSQPFGGGGFMGIDEFQLLQIPLTYTYYGFGPAQQGPSGIDATGTYSYAIRFWVWGPHTGTLFGNGFDFYSYGNSWGGTGSSALAPQTPQLRATQEPQKKPCTPLANNLSGPAKGFDTVLDSFGRLTHPMDVLAVNVTFFLSGAGAIFAGGAAIGAGCVDPSPFEPATCLAGVAGGAPAMAGGGVLIKQGVSFFKNYTLPAFEDWGCHD